jgi:hypothetical protein
MVALLATICVVARADRPVWAGGNGTVTNGNNWTTGNAPGKSDVAQVKNHADNPHVVGSLEFGALEFSDGIIDGTGSLTLSLATATSLWTGGEFSGATINYSAALEIGSGNAKKVSSGAHLNLGGATTWGADNLTVGGSAVITNTGAFTTSFDGKIAHDTATTRGTFTNNGTFTKSSATAGTTEIETLFQNNGSLMVNGGTLKLSGGGSSAGAAHIAAGAHLEFASVFELKPQSEISGTGTGVVSGQLSWLGGDMLNAGITRVLAGGELLLAGNDTKRIFDGGATGGGRVIENFGAIVVSGSAGLLAGDGGGVDNKAGGTVDFQSDAGVGLTGSVRGLFNNAGTVQKSAGTGTTTITGVQFNNGATVWAKSGTLAFTDVVTNSGGTFLAAPGATIMFGGNVGRSFSSGTRFVGGGKHDISAGISAFSGDFTADNLTFSGGTLTGSPTMHGTLTWTGGDWVGDATFLVASDGILTIDGTGVKRLYNGDASTGGRVLSNQGTIIWQDGGITLADGARVAIASGAVFDIRGDASLTYGGTGEHGSVANSGLLEKTGGTGTTTIAEPFTLGAGGRVTVSSGTLALSSLTNQGGTISVQKGARLSIASDLDMGTSTLSGTGQISTPLITTGGLVSPGSSPGRLELSGGLTLLATSSLLFELGGRSQGVNYDLLAVGGAGIVGGTLQVTFVDGFQASVLPTDTFTILTTGQGLTGVFNNVTPGQRLFTLDGTGSFQVNYGAGSSFNPASLVLSDFTIAVPEPSSAILLGIGGLALAIAISWRKLR